MNTALKNFRLFSVLAIYLFASEASAQATQKYVPITYEFEVLAAKKRIDVTISIEDARYLSHINFKLKDSQCRKFVSDDVLEQNGDWLLWKASSKKMQLSYQCQIKHKRPSKHNDKAYDAYITDDWTIFRGDDMVPPARVKFKSGAQTQAQLVIRYPPEWNGANTGWERNLEPPSEKAEHSQSAYFFVNKSDRRFDRPTGWMIAGKLGTRRLKYEEPSISRIAVSAPQGSSFKQMDILTFLQFIWPEFTKVCGHSPEKLLIVGADDPMWRGGLSAGNSFFMHADRPLVSQNGTSTLIHELFHMCTGISGKPKADWIAEGLAEFYSIEILYRAGGLNKDRHERSLASLRSWAKQANELELDSSKGATTAKAVLLFDSLNRELLDLSEGKRSLDDLVLELKKKKKVDKYDLEEAFQKFAKKTSTTLKSMLEQ